MKFSSAQKQMMRTDPQSYAESISRKLLKDTLTELEYRYHDKGEEAIPDEAYDILHDHYWYGPGATKEKKSAKDVGGSKAVDVLLEVPMNSLDKFRTISEPKQKKFMKASSYTYSDKEDGISLALTYDNGECILATTRGEEGIEGKDVSRILKYARLPKSISYKKRLIVRAEFTMDKVVFQKFFSKGYKGKEYKTSRNLCAGLLNRNDPDRAIKKCRIVCYEIMKGKGAGGPLNVQLENLARWGFDVVPYKVVKKCTVENMTAYHDERKTNSERDIDGVVVTQNVDYKIEPGYPTHSYAFKINSLAASLLLPVKDVEWNETRLGRWAPRVMIEPTIIGGVEVSWFTGHNAFYIEHGYTKPKKKKGEKVKPPHEPRPINTGAMIRVCRSGDVIPFIMEVVEGAKKPSRPTGDYVKQGVHLRVVHEKKSDVRRLKELTHFFTELEVDGMKAGAVNALVSAGYTTVKKILNIKRSAAQTLPGFADKSGTQLYNAIQEAKPRMTFLNVARGSAVFGEGIGEKRLAAIYEAYPDIMDMAGMDVEELALKIRSIRGFKKLGDQVAATLNKFDKFCTRNGITLAAVEERVVTGASMQGQAILFTSVRDKILQDWILANGGKLASSVKSATALIIKDESAGNKKTVEAKAMGIPIYTLAKFRKIHRIS